MTFEECDEIIFYLHSREGEIREDGGHILYGPYHKGVTLDMSKKKKVYS